MKYVSNIFFLIWEFPQNVLGAVLFAIMYFLYKPRVEKHEQRFFIEGNVGISLGAFIFWAGEPENRGFNLQTNKRHEYGHGIQSKMLGPLYLPFIGFPSALRALYALLYFRVNRKSWGNYYSGFPEKWADRLGRVD